ncbi:MAG: HlyD family efflux transporter periplasmic adaptor subunit [Candidatus Pacebacteria bacterium]|nr:HlyD family efflux transporter periplasmic adaptor subunit [Candidatus Paceibacterota bacterium]
MSTIRSLITSWYSHGARHPRKSALALILVIGVTVLALTSGDTAEAPSSETATSPIVTLASVAVISSDESPFSLLGEVRSVSQAELRIQKTGMVTQVHVRPGQYVSAGQILAEIDGASERAVVLSAQGALASAQAQLDRVRAGDRSEDRASIATQAEGATDSLTSAHDRARTAYSQSYTLAQDAIFAQADDLFTDPYTVAPRFRVRTASYDESKTLEKERVAIGSLLETWKKNTTTALSDDVLDARLTEADRDLQRIKSFLDTVSSYVSEQELSDDLTATLKAAQEGVVLGARSNIDSARNVINAAQTGLSSARSNSEIARLAEQKTNSGARIEDVRVAESVVIQARGALQSAQAAYENSIIRTPIAGTVTTLNIARGDYVSSMATAAIVANPNAQEVEVFVSAVARERITVGQPVLLAGMYKGVVTTAAPGLDPLTQKARVTAAPTEKTTLVNGSFVELAFMATTTHASVASSTEFRIPLSAIKVLSGGLAVFSVSDTGVLIAHPITEGTIVGDRMIVRDVAPNLSIVTDVRGLREGESVEVAR